MPAPCSYPRGYMERPQHPILAYVRRHWIGGVIVTALIAAWVAVDAYGNLASLGDVGGTDKTLIK